MSEQEDCQTINYSIDTLRPVINNDIIVVTGNNDDDEIMMDNVQATTININGILLECASGSTSTPTSCNILNTIIHHQQYQAHQQQDFVSSLSSSSSERTNIFIEVQEQEEESNCFIEQQQAPLTSTSPTTSEFMFGFSVEPLTSSSTPIQSAMVDVYSRRRNVSSPLTIHSSRQQENCTTITNDNQKNQANNNSKNITRNEQVTSPKTPTNDEQQDAMFRVGSPQSPVSMRPLLIENVATSPTSFAPSTLTPRSNPSSDESKQYSITAFIAKYQERIKQQQNVWKDTFMNLRVCVWSGLLVFVILLTVFLFGLLAIFSVYASDNVEAAKAQSMGISGTVTLLNKMHKLESKLYEYGHNKAMDYTQNTYITAQEQYQQLESYFNCPRLNILGVDIVGIYNYSRQLAYLSACHDGRPIKPPKEILTLPYDMINNELKDDVIKSGYINVENPIIYIGATEPHANSTHILMISIMKTYGSPYVLMFGRYITLDRLEPISSFTSSCITLFNLRNQSELALLGVSLGTSFDGNASNVFRQISNEIDVKYQYGHSKVFALDSNVLQVDLLRNDLRVCVNDQELSSLISKGRRLASYHIIPDFYGEYTVVLRSDIVREYSVIIWSSCFLGIFVSWLLTFISLVIMIFFIELFVIRRILVVSKFVKSIIGTSDFTQRLKTIYKDEVGELAFYINRMLDVLDFTQKKMEHDNNSIKKLLEKTSIEEHKNRCVMNSVPDLVAFVDANDGTIFSVNNSFESKIARKAKNSSQSISQYVQEKLPIENLLQKFDEMSFAEARWETNLLSSLNTPVPVIINCTKSKVFSNSVGKPVDTFILVMKIIEQKKDIRSVLNRRRTIDEMKTFEEFDNMFNNPTLLSLFRIFLEKEKSAENLAFLEEVRAYKSTSTAIDRGKKQQEIISKYLEKSSNTFLNISHAVYESEYEKIKNGYGQLDLFEKLEIIVRQTIYADSFKRFSDWTLRPSSGRWSDAVNLLSE